MLLSEEIAAELPKKKEYGTVILLSGEEYQTGPQTEYPRIYKYQSCPQILRQAMDFYAEQAAVVPGVMLRTEGMKRIAVYSPVGRTGKTGFALALGKEIAKKRRTLYLNLEEYSGFAALYPVDGGWTLSELLYFLKKGKSAVGWRREAVSYTHRDVYKRQEMGGVPQLHPEQLQKYIQVFLDRGLDASFK